MNTLNKSIYIYIVYIYIYILYIYIYILVTYISSSLQAPRRSEALHEGASPHSTAPLLQAQERTYDPVLGRYRDGAVEGTQRHAEERERVAHLNRAELRRVPWRAQTAPCSDELGFFVR